MKLRKLNNRVMTSLIAIIVLLGIVPSVFAWSAPASITINKSSNVAYFTNQWGTSLTTGFYYVAGTGEIAYCADQEATGPGGTGYSLNDGALGNQAYLDGIQAILQNGYPYTTNGLSDNDARYATQIAIHWIENYYLGAGEGYDASIRTTTNAHGHDSALAWALALYDIGVNQPDLDPKVKIGNPSSWTNVGGVLQCTVQVTEDNTDHWTVTSIPAGTTLVGGPNFTGDVNLIIQMTDPAAYAASNKQITAIGYTSRDLSNIHVFSTSGGYQSMVAMSTQSNGLDPDVVTLEDATGQIRINKSVERGAGNVSAEAGATFQIYSSAYPSYAAAPDSARDTITTDGTGVATSKILPLGDYIAHQVSAPTGIWLAGDTVISLSGGLATANITDTTANGLITIHKSTNRDGILVAEPGATFQIYLSSAGSFDAASATEKDTITTDATGSATSKTFPYGNYTVKQISAPTGTLLNTTTWTVDVGTDSTGAVLNNDSDTLSVTNDATHGRVEINKTAGTYYAEAGATFQIYLTSAGSYSAANATERDLITTDSTGHAISKSLPYGVYTVHQSFAPVGTVAADDYQTTVGAVNNATNQHQINNVAQTCRLQIEKQGESLVSATKADSGYSDYDGNALSTYSFQYAERGMSGASFDVYVGAADIVDYQGNPKLVDLDGNGTRETALTAGTYIGRISTAAITQGDGSVKYIASMDGLPLGADGTAQYIAKEAIAPSGQTLSSATLTFNFTYSNQAITEIADLKTLQDTKQDVSITVQKLKESAIWNTTKSSFDWPTVGAEGILFGIYTAWDIKDADGKVLVPAGSLVDVMLTDAEGKGTSSADLPFGLYYAQELNITSDVVMDKDTTYTLVASPSADQTQAVVTVPVNGGQPILNREIAGVLEVYKLAADTNLPMPGVVFEVFDKDANLVDTLTTDENGKATTKVLPYGKYTLVETKTLTGYILSDKASFSIFKTPKAGETFSTTGMTISNQKMGEIEVYKVTADGSATPMSGVVFGVYDEKTDKEIARISTDKNGYGYVYVNAGDYYLKEISTWPGYAISTEKISVKGVTNSAVYTFREKNDTTTTKIQKTNTTGTTLAGMHFSVTDAETGKQVEMYYDQARQAYVALVSDKITAPQDAAVVKEGVTGADGTTQVLGLLSGHSYVISETVAPDGYSNDSVPVTLTIDKKSGVLGTARFVDSLITVKTGETANDRILICVAAGLSGLALISATVLILKKRRA